MYYYVVLAEDWCASIPSSWINEVEGVYRWPRNVSSRTAVSRQLEPDATWHKDTYDRILGPYDTEEQARKVESRMAQVSTEDEDHILWATQGNKGKRQRKRKHFDDMVELGSEGDDLLDKLPPPPVGLSRGEHTKGIQRPQCSGSIKKSSNTMKSGIIENEVHENCASKSGPSSVKINVETNGLGGDNEEGPLPSPIETDDVGGGIFTSNLGFNMSLSISLIPALHTIFQNIALQL
ncbi:uncharacterized protein LOC124164106 isoform X3 [Ischnura elegans]|nr:uncharacterized protein LOC124164106 isoform X3 [Ischnura elegans]XP_046397240.1 uncharacterized protein LOC124164106 isoform X3 [Ischnura elegans]